MSNKMRVRPDLYLPGFAHSGRAKRGMEMIDFRALGIMPGIAGGARGTSTEGDIITRTTDGRDLNAIWAEFQATVATQNAERQALIDFLTYGVQNPVEDVPQFVGDDFEEASEFGEPKGIRAPGSYFSLAFDFKWYDLAARFTWKFLADATAAQVEAINQAALEADNRLIFNRVLKTIFNNVNLTADINKTAYTVYKFYNADGTVPPTYKGNVHAGSHTHYLTSGAATVDPGDLQDIIEHLRHHGYSQNNGQRLVLMVNPAQTVTIRLFRAGTNGAQYDFVPAQGSPPFLLPVNQQLVGAQPAAELAGLTVAGVYGPLIVVEEDYIPAGYMLAFATGGRGALTNPVGLREHANPGLRGLRLIPGDRNDYPLVDSFYSRGFGTGIRQRGAGVVMQITTNGAYSIPAAYV